MTTLARIHAPIGLAIGAKGPEPRSPCRSSPRSSRSRAEPRDGEACCHRPGGRSLQPFRGGEQAAGADRRKAAGVAAWQKRPWQRDIADVVVVTGCEAARIEEALAGLSVRFVPNADWQTGIGSSIAAGVRALGDGVDGALIVPGDMPFLSRTCCAASSPPSTRRTSGSDRLSGDTRRRAAQPGVVAAAPFYRTRGLVGARGREAALAEPTVGLRGRNNARRHDLCRHRHARGSGCRRCRLRTEARHTRAARVDQAGG